MAWKKSSPRLTAAFEKAISAFPKAVPRKMFGYPAAFVNGQMASGLFQEQWFVRLAERDRTALLKTRGAEVFAPMKARPMKEYVVLPPSFAGTPAATRTWLAKSFAYAATLPPKAKKPR